VLSSITRLLRNNCSSGSRHSAWPNTRLSSRPYSQGSVYSSAAVFIQSSGGAVSFAPSRKKP